MDNKKNNWMNLPKEYSQDNSKFVILPIEYEKNLTYGEGTSNGPEEIIKASKHLEYYDEQFDNEPFVKGIKLFDSLKLKNSTPEEMVEKVSEVVSKQKDKFVIGIGGDHAITNGMIKGMESLQEEFSVIVLDAHSDFRDSWNGSSLNHACVSKQISKKHDVLLLGVRSQDVDEAKQIKESENVDVIKAYDFEFENFKKQLSNLKQKVFISIDVDVFDPSFIRNTGTPEPGGFGWNTVVMILKEIFSQKKVIGVDLVEFAPKENYLAESYALAKLLYKIMALEIFKKE